MSLEPILNSVMKNLKAGKIDLALLDLKSAKGMAPNDPRVYYYYARCYIKSRKYPEAIENLKKSIELSTDGIPMSYYYLGFSYIKNKEWQNGVEIINKGLKQDLPEVAVPAMYYYKSGALMELGKIKEAIEAAEKAVQLKPDDEDYKSHLDYLKKK
ncbi:MAG: tetratricopeptide repeat protein [Candidatus Helarchaeota archaeon]